MITIIIFWLSCRYDKKFEDEGWLAFLDTLGIISTAILIVQFL